MDLINSTMATEEPHNASVPDSVEEASFTNKDNLRLYGQLWSPGGVRALVFIIHGLNEHSAFCYEDTVVRPLLKIGCMVVAHDHVGHGRSEGDRKVVGKIENLARDVSMHIMEVRARKGLAEDVPTFLYGHSLGGLIACIISLEMPEIISGMVLEAPALSINDRAGSHWASFMLARVLSFVIPYYVLRKPIFSNLSRNPLLVEEACNDEYRNKDGLTLGTAVNITNAIYSLQSRLKDIQTPFFVAHGEMDTIVSVSASETLQKEAAVTDKSFHVYNNAFHLLRGDCGEVGDDFTFRLVRWIDSHIQ